MMKLTPFAICMLFILFSACSIAAPASQGDLQNGPVEWRLLRAIDTLGLEHHLINHYLTIEMSGDNNGYFYSVPSHHGHYSTIHPHPKGTLHHSNHTGAAYLLPLDIDSSGKGLYDFRHGVHMPNVTGIKYSNFYADPGSRQLVYDDDDGNEHGGLWIARHRPERDGSAYIRWFNGDGSVPEEYFEVKLLRDRVTLCEVLECPRERPEVCDDVECEWEDV